MRTWRGGDHIWTIRSEHVDRESLDPEKGAREKFQNDQNHPLSGGQVAADLGFSWNQTPKDLQRAKEQIREREVHKSPGQSIWKETW